MFWVLGQALPMHLITTVPTAPHLADEKPVTYKGSITCSVSHNKQLKLELTAEQILNHPVCSRETQEGGASILEDVLF